MAQASQPIRAVSPEPLLFAHIQYGSRQRVQPKIRHLAPLDGWDADLKNEFTEDEKCHNLMRWLKYKLENDFLTLYCTWQIIFTFYLRISMSMKCAFYMLLLHYRTK